MSLILTLSRGKKGGSRREMGTDEASVYIVTLRTRSKRGKRIVNASLSSYLQEESGEPTDDDEPVDYEEVQVDLVPQAPEIPARSKNSLMRQRKIGDKENSLSHLDIK